MKKNVILHPVNNTGQIRGYTFPSGVITASV